MPLSSAPAPLSAATLSTAFSKNEALTISYVSAQCGYDQMELRTDSKPSATGIIGLPTGEMNIVSFWTAYSGAQDANRGVHGWRRCKLEILRSASRERFFLDFEPLWGVQGFKGRSGRLPIGEMRAAEIEWRDQNTSSLCVVSDIFVPTLRHHNFSGAGRGSGAQNGRT